MLLALQSRAIADATTESQQRPLSTVQHIDHIMIRADKPEELYTFFTELLQLPVAWPLADRGGVISGAAAFGNVNVEAIRFPGQRSEPGQTHFVGFGLKPIPLRESLAELARRGIAYGEPRPFVSTAPNGVRMTFFTNVTLTQFSDSDRPVNATTHIFLSEYNPAYVNVDDRRARLRRELAARHGGPLGVTGVKEVIIGTTDSTTTNRLWETLLRPTGAVASGLWQIGDGPAVRVVPAEEDRLRGLVISVASLPRAIAFLRERGVLGSTTEKEATISPSAVHGLTIRVIESIEPSNTEMKLARACTVIDLSSNGRAAYLQLR